MLTSQIRPHSKVISRTCMLLLDRIKEYSVQTVVLETLFCPLKTCEIQITLISKNGSLPTMDSGLPHSLENHSPKTHFLTHLESRNLDL